jgi:hypothetical protein
MTSCHGDVPAALVRKAAHVVARTIAGMLDTDELQAKVLPLERRA